MTKYSTLSILSLALLFSANLFAEKNDLDLSMTRGKCCDLTVRSLNVRNNAAIGGNLSVAGNETVGGNETINGNLQVNGNFNGIKPNLYKVGVESLRNIRGTVAIDTKTFTVAFSSYPTGMTVTPDVTSIHHLGSGFTTDVNFTHRESSAGGLTATSSSDQIILEFHVSFNSPFKATPSVVATIENSLDTPNFVTSGANTGSILNNVTVSVSHVNTAGFLVHINLPFITASGSAPELANVQTLVSNLLSNIGVNFIAEGPR